MARIVCSCLILCACAAASAPAEVFGQACYCPPRYYSPGEVRPTPESRAAPEAGTAPDTGMAAESPTEPLSEAAPQLAANFRAGGGEYASAGGYIDPAFIATMFRLRYDAAFNNPAPDRAEFFYPACGCLRLVGASPNAPGPAPTLPPGANPLTSRIIETGVDYQELIPYFEWAARPWLSGFVETPIRFLDPEVNESAAGFSDMIAGFKAAILIRNDDYLTFQLKTYLPTGDGGRGLGTDHVSIEPGLLFQKRTSCRSFVFGELRLWVPVDGFELEGEDFAGEVVRYGLGYNHDLITAGCGRQRLSAVTELVGWTILSGFGTFSDTGVPATSQPPVLRELEGDTIVNLKLGLRYTSGCHSVYGGWGHGLTGDVWYEDIARLEYRRIF